MRNGSAETLLALFTSPDRASSIVGDLREQTPSHRHGWFSAQVARTVAALFWQDLTSAPVRILGLAVLGSLLHELGNQYAAIPLAQANPFSGATPFRGAWFGSAFIFAYVFLPFAMAWVLSRFSGDRPMSVCVVLALVGQNLVVAAHYAYGYWIAMRAIDPALRAEAIVVLAFQPYLVSNAVVAIPMLAAGYLYRRDALQRGTAR